MIVERNNATRELNWACASVDEALIRLAAVSCALCADNEYETDKRIQRAISRLQTVAHELACALGALQTTKAPAAVKEDA
ncbi:MAG TPA: hypothetical protein VNM48_09080 [Chloroflexota bacterium]|nr:hypothetical protein [Chloroflexota bacterium]